MITAAATTRTTNGRIVVVSPVFTALLFFAVSFSAELSVCAEDEEPLLLLSELSFTDTVLPFPESEVSPCVEATVGVGVTESVSSEPSTPSGPTSCLLQAIPNGLNE